MRRVCLLWAVFSLLLLVSACNSDDSGGGGEVPPANGGNLGITAARTTVVDSDWVNAMGRKVPYNAFGITAVSAGRGRALPSGCLIIIVTPPSWGTLSKGNTYYTPNANYTGEDWFTFKVKYASGKVDPRLFKLTFSKVDAQPPLVSFQVAYLVQDADNQTFAWVVFVSPEGLGEVRVEPASLTADSGAPVWLGMTVTPRAAPSPISDGYMVGNFIGCATRYYFTGTIRASDPAGNWSAPAYLDFNGPIL